MSTAAALRPARPRILRSVALLCALAVLAAACSDAYTEEQRITAEGGANPTFINIYVPERIAPTIDELTKMYELDNANLNFVVLVSRTEVLADTVDSGARPAIWIDDAEAQASYLDLDDVVGEPRELGFDELQFIVLPGNPRRVSSVRVFGSEASRNTSALCQISQPCGRGAYEALRLRRIEPDPDVTYGDGEAVIRAVVREVVDAGIVYRTDSALRPVALSVIPMPDPTVGRIDYQALQLAENPNADAFLDWATSAPEAIQVLAEAGLLPLSTVNR